MNKINFILIFFLCFLLSISALSLVASQHYVRRQFMLLEQAKAHGAQLAMDFARLQYEHGTLIQTTRIKHLATTTLHMRVPIESQIFYLKSE